MQYEFGSVVKISTTQKRHDSIFSVAVVMDEGATVIGDLERYAGLFMDNADEPTLFAFANLYTDEIDSLVKKLDKEELVQIMSLTREMRGYTYEKPDANS